MPIVRENFAAGEDIDHVDGVQMAKNANDGGGFRDTVLAGETITVSGNPLPVSINPADGKVYKSDANEVTNYFKQDFSAFCLATVNSGDPAKLQMSGVVRGFSGLAAGYYYYLQDDGSIGVTPSLFRKTVVGLAVSATELLIVVGSTNHLIKQLVRGDCPNACVNGNYLYLATGSNYIYRFKIDANGSLNDEPGSLTHLYWIQFTGYEASYGLTSAGDYIYTWATVTGNTPHVLLKIAVVTGTVTQMTISGTAPSNTYQKLTSDGTYIYITANANGNPGSKNLYKYSISGSTATYVSTITLYDYPQWSLGCDGTFFYYNTNPSSGADHPSCFVKDTMAGSNVRIRYFGNNENAMYSAFFVFDGVLYGLQSFYNVYGNFSQIIPFDFS